MLPKRSIRWMAQVESQLEDKDCSLLGLHVWPVVRNTVMLLVLPFSRASWPLKERRAVFIRFFESIKSLFFIKRYDSFFLTDSKYSQLIRSEYHLKDVDSTRIAIGKNKHRVCIGLQDAPSSGMELAQKNTVSLYAITVLAAIVARAYPLISLNRRVSKFLDHAILVMESTLGTEEAPDISGMRTVLRRNLIFVVVSAALFRYVLRRVKPEQCYVHCYYSLLGMAFCAACRELKIPVTDVQHGISGKNMRAYSRWEKIPPTGYNTLPNRFWVWTKNDANAINEWAGELETGPAAELVGQLWLERLKESGLYRLGLEEWASFFDQIGERCNRIVITLQAPRLCSQIESLIESDNGENCFLIRAHPDVPFDRLPESVIKFEREYENVFIQEPTKMPIHVLMANSGCHVTEWSASVYDAHFAGVRSIVLTASGRDYFEEWISAGLVYYSKNIDELSEYIDVAKRLLLAQSES